MKITATWKVKIDSKEAKDAVEKASRLGMRDTVVDIHGSTIENARSVGFWLTGHNARSIASEVSGMGVVKKGADAKPERVVDDRKIEGAIYSTSGYGGLGETGTVYMKARPYFRPALDTHMKDLPKNIKGHMK